MDLATRILIVDDDTGIRNLMTSFLEKHGFVADTAENPQNMREKMAVTRYDLIVLDVMMPGEDGLTALTRMKGEGGPPIIMLSAVGSDIDRIVGLEMGADDYLAKPCNPRELLARIRAVLRRGDMTGRGAPPEDEEGAVRFADWRANLDARTLYNPDGAPVILSDGEFRLLRAFVEHPRRTLSRDQLLDYAHGEGSENYDRAVDVQVSRLRRKLRHAGSPEIIRTVRSEGYIFMPQVTR